MRTSYRRRSDTAKLEYLAMFTGKDNDLNAHQAVTVRVDEAHDLALLKFEGNPFPAMSLGQSSRVREGEECVYRLSAGCIFGLYPVTHRGTVSAITPIALQANAASQLDPTQIRRLRPPTRSFSSMPPPTPGNSGSPLYHTETTEVIGVINKVFVKDGRENVLAKPSGISYAMPIEYARELLERAGLD